MFSLLLGIKILGGGSNVNAMPVIYQNPSTAPSDCEHRTDYSDAIYWYNGEIVNDHDDSIIPEDCLVSEIESGSCGYGIVGYDNP